MLHTLLLKRLLLTTLRLVQLFRCLPNNSRPRRWLQLSVARGSPCTQAPALSLHSDHLRSCILRLGAVASAADKRNGERNGQITHETFSVWERNGRRVVLPRGALVRAAWCSSGPAAAVFSGISSAVLPPSISTFSDYRNDAGFKNRNVWSKCGSWAILPQRAKLLNSVATQGQALPRLRLSVEVNHLILLRSGPVSSTRTHMRRRVIIPLWILIVGVAMMGWVIGLGWVAAWLTRHVLF